MSLTVEKCLQAWTNSLRQLNFKADLVFFGDSLTYYGDFASVFPDKKVCNLGLRGDTIEGMIDRVDQVSLMNPEVVYLMAGINDVASYSPKEFEEKYGLLLNLLTNDKREKSIIVQNILPVNDRKFNVSCNNDQIMLCNNIIRQLVKKYNLYYLDLFSSYKNVILTDGITIDGIHLSSQGYVIWYKTT